MANEDHAALLNQGVEIWSEWRKENLYNPYVTLDFVYANLEGACGGAVFSGRAA